MLRQSSAGNLRRIWFQTQDSAVEVWCSSREIDQASSKVRNIILLTNPSPRRVTTQRDPTGERPIPEPWRERGNFLPALRASNPSARSACQLLQNNARKHQRQQ